jgi:hypothetical protein
MHIWGGGGEKNISINEYESIPTKLDESSNLVSRGQNPLKPLYSIMIIYTISMPYKSGSIKNNRELKATPLCFKLVHHCIVSIQ